MRKLLGISLLALAPAFAPAAAAAAAHAASVAASPAARQGPAADRMATRPPAAWQADDPADSLYRSAKNALNDGDFRRAASLFRRVSERYPRSAYAADALYWEAFALYRLDDERSLRQALQRLDAQRSRFPSASTASDAKTLATRIQGRLAQLGDASAAGEVATVAAGERSDKMDKRDKSLKGDKGGKADRRGGDDSTDPACRRGGRGDDDEGPDEDSDTRIVALNSLLQMDAERAMPILRQVLARRDVCSELLRRKAVFLVAQQNTPESADILLAAARSDPDRGVRRQAIFWLSQVHSDRAVTALDSILHASSADEELRERAIFALSQQSSTRSWSTLRDFAKSDAPVDLRRKAVFWIGQQDHSAENATFLRTLYASPAGAPLREEIIQAAANAGAESDAWLLSIARDPKQDVEQRKKALFWLGQQRNVPASEFASLYDTIADRDVKEHLIFVLSQRREKAAVDKLFDIARHDADKSLRGKALFWLGQSNDPRVQQLLMEIINQ